MMIEKKITIKNVKLTYYDNNNKGSTILMIHGNSLNASLFSSQFEENALKEYRLLAIDLPGHGKTGKTFNPERDYSIANYIQIIIEFLNRLRIDKVLIVGHSLGGHIAIHVADEIRETKILGLLLTGTPPLTIPPKLEEAFLPNPAITLSFKPDLSPNEVEQLATLFCSEKSYAFDLVKASIENCDPLVRPFIGQSIRTDLITDESEILKQIATNIAIVSGKEEAAISKQYIEDMHLPLWKEKIFEIDNAGHSPFIENKEAFNRILVEFIDASTGQ